MRIANRDRLWLLGGLIVALLLVLVAWQFMIKSQHDETNSVRESVASANQQINTTTNRLNALRADNVNLDKYKAALAADQAALPATSGLPDFVRQLQAASTATGCSIVQIQIGQPTAVVSTTAGALPVYSVSINIVVSGPISNTTAFLNQLQAVQPRAVLLTSVAQSPGVGDQVQLNIAMSAFVSPVDGKAPAAS